MVLIKQSSGVRSDNEYQQEKTADLGKKNSSKNGKRLEWCTNVCSSVQVLQKTTDKDVPYANVQTRARKFDAFLAIKCSARC